MGTKMCAHNIILLLQSLSAAPKAPRKTHGELAKFVDADYYGYRDEDDGVIVPLEQEEERKGWSNVCERYTELLSYRLVGIICVRENFLQS